MRQPSKGVSVRLKGYAGKKGLWEGMQQPHLTTYAEIAEVRTVTGAAACNQLLAKGWVLLGVHPLTNDEWLLGLPSKPRRDWRGFQDKTLWDWMALLIVPIFIAAASGGLAFLQFWIQGQRADDLKQIEDD